MDVIARKHVLLKPLLTAAKTLLVLWALLRLLLWWFFGRASDVGGWSLLWVMPSGIVNDWVVLTYVLFPLTLYLALAPARWHSSILGRTALRIGFGLTLFGFLYLCAVEFYFFEEFDARFNLVAFDYLMYPTEVIGDIRDSYPVTQVLIAAAVTAVLITVSLRNAVTVPAGTLATRRRGIL